MSSHKFTEQIKRLEEEGAQLLAATNHLGDSLAIPDKYSKRGTANTSLNLSALTDISAEQKTISDLRVQLDAQCKETERLHKEMFNTSGSSVPREPAMPSAFTSLEIPMAHHNSYTLPASNTRHNKSYTTDYQSHLSERQLKDAQSEIKELQSRLQEAINISEKQKAHFRSTIEDLRIQLQNAVSGREALLTKSKREVYERDSVVCRLEETVEHLEKANQLQEETLLEMNDKLEHFQKDKYIVDTTAGQIRDILVARERGRGRVFYENEPISKQSITMLVHSIERAFNDVDYDVNKRQDKVDQLILELDDVKLKQERKEDQIILEYERKMCKQREDHSMELVSLTDQAQSNKEKCALFQDKNHMLEKQLDQQVRTREDHIVELEDKIKLMRHEHGLDQSTWADKKAALEEALDGTQKEISLMRADKDAAIRRTAQVESRFTDMQMSIDKLTADLTTDQEKLREIVESDLKAKANVERLQIQLRHKDEVLSEVEHKFKVVRQESDTHIQTAINTMEKEGKAFIEKEMSSLKLQLQTMTEKCHALQLELEVTKSQYGHLKEKYEDAKTNLEKTRVDLEQANTKQQSLTAMISDKVAETERVIIEKEHYHHLYTEYAHEISTLKSLREKLTIQLEEREKNFLQLQQQNDRMAEVMATTTKNTGNFREERDLLQQKFNEKIIETEEIRKMRDNTTRKLKIREKKIQELEMENLSMVGELGERKSGLCGLEGEKEKLYQELKHSRYEVATLQQDKSNLETQLEQIESSLNKQISKMSKRLKSSEHDLKLTKKTLTTKENVDKRAVKVAGDMQKEVTVKRGQLDTLQTRIHWLEECLEAAAKDKKCLEDESDSLIERLEKSGHQSDKLSQELRNKYNKCEEYKQRVHQLEGALEKAAVKNGNLETQLEQHQQDNVRLKLKHQLELKELQRNGKSKHHHHHTSSEYTQSHTVASAPNAGPSLTYTMQPTSTQSVPASLLHPPTFTQMRDCEEAPVRDTAKQDPPATDDREINEELRALVYEMRSVLHTQRTGTSNLSEATVFSDSELQPPVVRKGSARGRRDKRRTHKQVTRPNHHTQGPASPVSDLLLTFDEIQSDSCLLSGNDSYDDTLDVQQYKSYHDITPAGLTRTAGIVPAAQGVCQRLEQKIENLSKMGSHIQSEHKEMARVMQDQDRKLQKVKNQMR